MGFLLHVYIESGPRYGEMIKQRSSYTPYHSNILTEVGAEDLEVTFAMGGGWQRLGADFRDGGGGWRIRSEPKLWPLVCDVDRVLMVRNLIKEK